MWRAITGLLAATLLAGCLARTEVASYTDPAYVGRPKFTHVLVLISGVGLAERQQGETLAVAELHKIGVRGKRSIEVLPPTRKLSTDAVAEAIDRAGVDAVLVMSLSERGTKETFVPPTYHPGQTKSTINFIGSQAYVTTTQAPGYTTGGYNIKKPRAVYAATLVDPRTGGTVWTAEGSSRGNAFATFHDLTLSATQGFIKSLRADGRL